MAECEYNYRIALAMLIASERIDGTPVSIIGDVARGDPKVAKLRYERDVAKTRHEAIKEIIYTRRMELRIAREETNEDRKGI